MKTYGQYCGLAKALDHIGDRWTLLIVRELLLGPRRYSEMRAALPGIATNLLADRLRHLRANEVISKSEDGSYELTEFGRELEDVIHGLVRWGGRWMGQRRPSETFHAEWLAVALKALLPKLSGGRVQIETPEATISLDRGEVRIASLAAPDAVVKGSPETILGVAAGHIPLSAVNISGSRDVVAAIFPGRSPD